MMFVYSLSETTGHPTYLMHTHTHVPSVQSTYLGPLRVPYLKPQVILHTSSILSRWSTQAI